MGNSVKLTWHTEKRKLGDLIEWDKNPRQLKEHDAEHLKKSLDAFGVADPLIINTDNRIIGGHMRRRIMLKSGYKPDDLVDVRVPERELTEREAEELAIRLNKNTGDWDFDALANNFELDDLLDWGFDKKELDLDLWADEPPEDVEPQIDKAEELREKWGVESGQLWKLGEHRLICGDCTDKAVVDRVMGGEKADMVFTDPPYGMRLDADFSNMKGIGRGNKYENIEGDFIDYDPKLVFERFGYCKEIILWGADYYAEKIPNRNDGSWFVWDKMGDKGVNDDYDKMFGSNFELCWSKARHKRALVRVLWKGIFGLSSEDTKSRVHPTQKPVELAVWFYEKFTKDGAIIVDLYSGSGSFLIACERLGRKCRAVEISPAYVAVAIQRWVDVTGGTPELVEPVMQVEAD